MGSGTSLNSKNVHCIGVSGAGMLPLAICLKQSGAFVSGEDDNITDDARKILERNDIAIGRISDLEEEDTLVVFSSAVKDSHPSLVEALRCGWSRIPRGECLAEMVRNKRLIAVAGSHGKTTTTGILIDLFEAMGEEVSYALGGLFANGKDPGRWNQSEWMVAELDESDGTIERFSPEISVILNVDHDHHTTYDSGAAYRSAFVRLANRTTGAVVVSDSIREYLGKELEDIGKKRLRTIPAEPLTSALLGDFSELNQRHAMAAAVAAGFSMENLKLDSVTPIKRRQTCHYFSPHLKVIEDYAHHPAEIAAVCSGLRNVLGGPLVAVFQPHRYSRTRSLKDALAKELSRFDYVHLLDVYGASEEPVAGGTGKDLFDACRSVFSHCEFHPDGEEALLRLSERLKDNTPLNVLFLGAGRTDELALRFTQRVADSDSRWGPLYCRVGQVLNYGSKIRSHESLRNKTTLRVGGEAELYFEPASEAELVAALKTCQEASIPVYPLGRGSNLIVPERGVSGLVIRLSHPHWRRFEALPNGEIRVGAGLRIKELCGLACKAGLEGFEFLEGIPGSVGGALRMNAGAMGGWMFDVVKSVRFVTLEGELVESKTENLTVGYRHCRELEKAIALDAVLSAKAVGQEEAELRKAIDVYQSKRKESQPREPSAGCIFKNPEGASAGQLIDELGLKGTAIGGAEISKVHGNFIINRGGATSEDVIELVRLVRRVAKARRSIELEPEALLYGEEWKEVLA